MIEVFGIHVGDDHSGGAQAREGAVAFVGLHHHPLALAHARIGAVGVDDAAIDDGGVLAAGVEQSRDHRGGGGFAVRAADRDGPFQPHDLGQHFRAPHDGHAARARGIGFRIAVLDGGRNHHHARMRRVLGLVADEDLHALRAQPLGVGAFLGVGARHLVAEVLHHRGNARHADAANADEMNGTGVERNGAADHGVLDYRRSL